MRSCKGWVVGIWPYFSQSPICCVRGRTSGTSGKGTGNRPGGICPGLFFLLTSGIGCAILMMPTGTWWSRWWYSLVGVVALAAAPFLFLTPCFEI